MADKANTEGMKRLQKAINEGLTYHGYVNEYIALKAQPQYQAYLEQHNLKDNEDNKKAFYNSLPKYPGTDIAIMEIDGLYENTGILEHIGLGRFYGKPIIYIDSSLEAGEKDIVKGHGKEEIAGWAIEKDIRNIIEWSDMRDFIIANYTILDYERIKDDIHNKANEKHNVDLILEKYGAEHTNDLLKSIESASFKKGDVVIAGGGNLQALINLIPDLQLISEKELKRIQRSDHAFAEHSSKYRRWYKGHIEIYILESADPLFGIPEVREQYYKNKRVREYATGKRKTEPIIVQGDTLLILDGRHRLYAAELRSIKFISVYIGVNEYLGSPQAVFRLLTTGEFSDGESHTKQEIAEALEPKLAVSTIEPDLYFLRDCGLLEIKERVEGKGGRNTYAIKPELKSNLTLMKNIQSILDEKFEYGKITNNLRIKAIRDKIIKRIKDEITGLPAAIGERSINKPFSQMGFEELIWWYKALTFTQFAGFFEEGREEIQDLLIQRFALRKDRIGTKSFFTWAERILGKEYIIPIAMYREIYKKYPPILQQIDKLKKEMKPKLESEDMPDKQEMIYRKYAIKFMRLVERFNSERRDKFGGQTLFEKAFEIRDDDTTWSKELRYERTGVKFNPIILHSTPSLLTIDDIIYRSHRGSRRVRSQI